MGPPNTSSLTSTTISRWSELFNRFDNECVDLESLFLRKVSDFQRLIKNFTANESAGLLKLLVEFDNRPRQYITVQDYINDPCTDPLEFTAAVFLRKCSQLDIGAVTCHALARANSLNGTFIAKLTVALETMVIRLKNNTINELTLSVFRSAQTYLRLLARDDIRRLGIDL